MQKLIPEITIKGIPDRIAVLVLEDKLTTAVGGVLGIKPKDVWVFICRGEHGLAEKISCRIEGLGETHTELRKKVAGEVFRVISEFTAIKCPVKISWYKSNSGIDSLSNIPNE